jgi:hypothetical protein
MGVDRPGAGTDDPGEAAEEPPPPERRPPPDRPGAEGAPSRADSRNGAAAANETSDQAAENQGENEPDTAQARPETSEREDNTTVENEPEAPGTSESNEALSNDDGSGERNDNHPTQKDPAGRPDTAQPSEEAGDPKDTDRRNQAPDGQAVPHDNTTPSETDRQPAPAGATERAEDKGARETSATDANDSANAAAPSAVDIGDRPDNATKQPEDALATAPDAQEPSRASLDAPADVAGDDGREPTHPTDVTTEAAARPPEVEGQSETAEKHQVDPPDQALPAADASTDAERDANQASDGPREKIEAAEAGEDAGATLTESTETLGKRLERPNNEARLETGDEPDAEGTSIVSKQDVGDRLMVHGTPLREYLDPAGAAAWSNEIGDVVNERSGDRIVDGESDKDSRFERLRKKGFEKGDDALETASKATNRAHDLLARQPPAGHVETRSGPDVTAAPHQGVDGGDALATAVMASVLVSEGIRRVHGKVTRRRGQDDAGNR